MEIVGVEIGGVLMDWRVRKNMVSKIPTDEQIVLELLMPLGCDYSNLIKYAVCGEL